MAENLLWREDVHRAARLVSLLRLLLLALSLGLWAFLRQRDREADVVLWQPAINSLEWLLVIVSVLAALMLVAVPWVSQRWQLVMHLVFDLFWVGMVIYYTGGISGPGAVLLFAVVLTSNLLLPGTLPFVMPLVASLVMVSCAMFYLVGQTPFDVNLLGDGHPLTNPPSVIGNLAIQIGALFLVDLLGQTLSRRLSERDLLTNELIEHLHDAVLVVDRDGRILYSNARFAELLDLAALPQRGQRIQHVLGLSIHVPLLDLFASDGDQLLTIRRSDSVLVCHRHPLIGRRRRIVGTVLTITDETRLRRLKGKLSVVRPLPKWAKWRPQLLMKCETHWQVCGAVFKN